MEISINALRKHIGKDDKCDELIVAALSKGPKRIRIASREELKIEINKYKQISLRLVEEMKRAGIKVPGYAQRSNLEQAESGIREEIENIEGGGQSQLSGDMMSGAEDNEAQMIGSKGRKLADSEMRAKNDRIAELMRANDDLKITVYSRD